MVATTDLRVGINGFSRIGRLVLRAALHNGVKVVAINDPFIKADYMSYMFKYDSVHGRYKGTVSYSSDQLIIDGFKIQVFDQSDPGDIQWSTVNAHYVLDATGNVKLSKADLHVSKGGAKKVLICSPCDEVPTFVFGVNNHMYKTDMKVISCACSTINCVAPVAKVINDHFGIVEALLTTVRAMSECLKTVDGPSCCSRRAGRSALTNIIPVATEVNKTIAQVIPELTGKLSGMAIRVPISDVSVVDLTCKLSKKASYDDIVGKIKAEASADLKDVLKVTEELLVSSDFIGCQSASVFDVKAGIALNDTFVKVVAWFDNEYGYSCQMIRLLKYINSRDNDNVKSKAGGDNQIKSKKCCGCFG